MVITPADRNPVSPTPEQQLRSEWADALREELAAKDWTVKAFHQRLLDAGSEVSVQSVYSWLAGNTSPTPINQAYCAKVLRVPARRLFPLPEVA